MLQKIMETIKENSMFSKEDKIIVGVSGGPDSMCLLHILSSLRYTYSIDIVAAHLNHGLRGKDADEDEEYVKIFCEKNNIEFYSRRVNIEELSNTWGISSEMAGREARYSFFLELFDKLGANKIAIAHNANDQCETILMRIIRGTGLEGLEGIKPVRDEIYIRPLIKITREEIEHYCDKNNINPRIDKTNLQNIYSRNKIRLELIPYIRENFNSHIIEVVNRLGENVKIDNDFIEKKSKEFLGKYCIMSSNKVKIKKEAFNEHKALISRMIRRSIEIIKGNLVNFERVHVEYIISLQRGSTGKEIELPGGIRALNNYGEIILSSESKNEIKKDLETYNISLNEKNKIGIFNIETNVLDKKLLQRVKEDSLEQYFDYEKVDGEVSFRYRKEGDKFQPLGMKGTKKLKDIFIDLKIPKDLRNNIPIICIGEEIAWIVGYRISDKFKVDKNTTKLLKIKLESEE